MIWLSLVAFVVAALAAGLIVRWMRGQQQGIEPRHAQARNG